MNSKPATHKSKAASPRAKAAALPPQSKSSAPLSPAVAGSACALQGDKQVEAVLEHFRDRERGEAFYEFFRELQDIYEILSPDAFLRPFLADYNELLRMFHLVRSAYERGQPVDKEFLRKTARLVQEHPDRRDRTADKVPSHHRGCAGSHRQGRPARHGEGDQPIEGAGRAGARAERG